MTGLLEKAHGHDRKKVPHMKTVAGGVESAIECDLRIVEHSFNGIAVCFLIDESAPFEFIIDLHVCTLPF